MKPVVELLFENAKKYPDRLAVVFENGSATYRELAAYVCGLANYFKEIGVQKGDRVVVKTHHAVGFDVAVFACHALGAVFVPVDKTAPVDRIREIVAEVDAALVISDVEIDAERKMDFSELLPAAERCAVPEFKPQCALDDLADIMYTSGTTGKPKGAVLTHSIIATISQLRVKKMEYPADNVSLISVPLNHVTPMRELYDAISNGSTACFIDGVMKIKTFFDFIRDYGVTSLYLPPAQVRVLLEYAGTEFLKYRDRIHHVMIGSATFDEKGKRKFREVLPESELLFGYGSSENGSVSFLNFSRYDKAAACCGPIHSDFGVEVRIVDDAFRDLPRGECGRIIIRSPMNIKGYWNRPDLNETLYHGEWFVTNDAGYFDEDQFLYVVGRIDDVINIGGLKVAPTEVEEAALGFEDVSECICIPVQDPLLGQAIKMIVVPREGTVFDEIALREYLSGKLDAFKVPSVYETATELKRTVNSKLDRKAYRA